MAKTPDFVTIQVDSSKILETIARLKKQIQEQLDKKQEALVREATLRGKLEDLSSDLQQLTGSADWSDIEASIAKAAKKAQSAVQRLLDALNEAGIDPE